MGCQKNVHFPPALNLGQFDEIQRFWHIPDAGNPPPVEKRHKPEFELGKALVTKPCFEIEMKSKNCFKRFCKSCVKGPSKVYDQGLRLASGLFLKIKEILIYGLPKKRSFSPESGHYCLGDQKNEKILKKSLVP